MSDLNINATLLGNGSFTSDSLSTFRFLASEDPYFHNVPMALYVFSVLSMLAILIVLPSLAWHIKSRNLPASVITVWVVYLNVFDLINTLVWPTDDIETWWAGYGYCDISVKLILGSPVGLICPAICILRSLAATLDADNIKVGMTPSEKRWKVIVELVWCFVVPLVYVLAHLLVQDHRYDIHALSGCGIPGTTGWPAVPIVYLPPVLLALVATYYSVLVLVRITRYRRNFAQVLSASTAGMSASRFLRLYSLAAMAAVVYLPIQVYTVYYNLTENPILSFDWATTHAPGSLQQIAMFPSYGVVAWNIWTYLALAAAVVLTIGLGSDAHAFYRDSLVMLGFGGIFPSLVKSQEAARERARLQESNGSGYARSPKRRPHESQEKQGTKQQRKWYSTLLGPLATLSKPLFTKLQLHSLSIKRNSRGTTHSASSSNAPLVAELPLQMSGALEAGMASAAATNATDATDATDATNATTGSHAWVGTGTGTTATTDAGAGPAGVTATPNDPAPPPYEPSKVSPRTLTGLRNITTSQRQVSQGSGSGCRTGVNPAASERSLEERARLETARAEGRYWRALEAGLGL